MEEFIFISFIFFQYAALNFYIGKNFLRRSYQLFFLIYLIFSLILALNFSDLFNVIILILIGINFYLMVLSLKSYLISLIYALGIYLYIRLHTVSIHDLYSYFSQIETYKLLLFLIGACMLQWSLFFVGILVFKEFYNKRKIYLFLDNEISTRRWLILLGLFFLILLIYIQQMYSILDRVYFWLLFIILVLKGGIFLSSIFFIDKLAGQYKKLSHIVSFYEEDLEEKKELKAFRHDYQEILLTIAIFLENGDTNGALKQFLMVKDYSKHIVFSKNDDEKLSKIKNLPIKSIILFKINEARSMGITVELTINTEINDLSIHVLDLVRCLTIILNNAIEASTETKIPYINIIISKKLNTYKIVIKNNYSNSAELEKIGKRGITTKKGHYGFGHSNLYQISQKYNTLSYTFFRDDTFFTVVLFLEEQDNTCSIS
ncbi:hypothetical protein D920_00250 [Enterococcus faecalis 13-SD-W-01]|nr:hypothetical protein D920_00250 [Enterococcus faecalis 13-SD-W-01]